MGCSTSQASTENRASTINSRAIDKMIQEEHDRQAAIKELKILLLGTGDSGKTTVLKQLRFLYGNGFTTEEILEFRSVLLQNVLTCAKALLFAMSTLQIPFGFDPKAVTNTAIMKSTLSIAKLKTGSRSNVSLNQSLACLPKAVGGSKASLPKPRLISAENPIAEAARQEYIAQGGQNPKGQIAEFAERVKAEKRQYGFGKGDVIGADVIDAIKNIWMDSGVQYCFSRRNEFQLQESCA
ncbi:UNVERIFIED_CONTAM: Guanine nucleotide-binding protein G(o) subunit alpha [Siphonaria sp. JEL0065]|nr:Guanine nucleotide-binding protein G(o) subunit alpha [Siphonaria sp. JEL0065]